MQFKNVYIQGYKNVKVVVEVKPKTKLRCYTLNLMTNFLSSLEFSENSSKKNKTHTFLRNCKNRATQKAL